MDRRFKRKIFFHEHHSVCWSWKHASSALLPQRNILFSSPQLTVSWISKVSSMVTKRTKARILYTFVAEVLSANNTLNYLNRNTKEDDMNGTSLPSFGFWKNKLPCWLSFTPDGVCTRNIDLVNHKEKMWKSLRIHTVHFRGLCIVPFCFVELPFFLKLIFDRD